MACTREKCPKIADLPCDTGKKGLLSVERDRHCVQRSVRVHYFSERLHFLLLADLRCNCSHFLRIDNAERSRGLSYDKNDGNVQP